MSMSASCLVLATLGFLADDAPKPKPSPEPAVLTCQVEGRTMILTVVPEGSRVHKGDVVCELDASKLRDRLVDQQLAMLKAERELRDAKQKRVVAEAASQKAQDNLIVDSATTVGELALFRSDLERARDRFAWMKEHGNSMRAMGIISYEQRVKDEAANFEKARIKLEVFEARTKVRDELLQGGPPKLKEAVAAEAARVDEKFKEEKYALVQTLAKKLVRQISEAWIVAPCDGTVQLANRKAGKPGKPLIEDGAMVHERQKLMTIEPD
jgi:HlyD family secretion protein